jgi:YHS domain-containing protein
MVHRLLLATLLVAAAAASWSQAEKCNKRGPAGDATSALCCPGGVCPMAELASLGKTSGEGCCEGDCPWAKTADNSKRIELTLVSQQGDASKEKAEKDVEVTCPISGRPVSENSTADYRGGKIHFCCDNCKAKFEKEPAKFAAKANRQLVASGQAEQIGCPLTGKKINPETAMEVGGTKVSFCCNGCKGRVTKAQPKEQEQMVFGDTAFGKGFRMKQNNKEPSGVSAGGARASQS